MSQTHRGGLHDADGVIKSIESEGGKLTWSV